MERAENPLRLSSRSVVGRRSFAPVTYLSKLLETNDFAAWLQLEIRWGISLLFYPDGKLKLARRASPEDGQRWVTVLRLV
ncbi:Uncharacterised protein [Serratia marcescens]|nr:hypothetical protein D4G80_02910 [Serratia marcescens]RXG82856.1 hypothetical protein D5F12_02905 [Serratia marcescens]CUZ22171.1 Uncharacterised protein [Serratia marcescens]CUZ40019.1 Uncharacterised protein [Serratia marcescens]CUZ40026.1 Uncharacterised protein [Serratia marcescens]